MTDKSVITTPISKMEDSPFKINIANMRTIALLEKSNITIKFLRLNLSAMAPPSGVKMMTGMVDTASIVAKISALPVTSRTYSDNANFKIVAPKSDIICPIITKLKFLLNVYI